MAMAGAGKPRVQSPGTTDHVRSTAMTPLSCLAWIMLFYFANVPVTSAHPIRNDTAATLAFTDPTTLTTSPTTTSYKEDPLSWRQPASLANGGRNRPSLTLLSFDPGCRKRVFCEAARTLTYAFPRSWEGQIRERPGPTNSYFGAWSKGMQGHDCSDLYPDCSDSPAGLVMPLLREAMGPHGIVKALVERMDAADVHHELMDRGAPRPSLVMEKLRQGARRLAAAEPQMPSSEFTPR